MDSSTDFSINTRPSFLEKDTAKKVNTCCCAREACRIESKAQGHSVEAGDQMGYRRVLEDVVGSVRLVCSERLTSMSGIRFGLR